MNTAIVVLTPSENEADTFKLMGAIKYVIDNACKGQFRNASMMINKKADPHIHEFKEVKSEFVTEAKFVKCIHCDQCFPLLPNE